MAGRRAFLSGLVASTLMPTASWADVGAPSFLAASKQDDDSFALCGLSAGGDIVFEVPLPGRGHAAAAHPNRAHAVAFARRPGVFALIVDCQSGQVLSQLHAPSGHHFYGHGVFSSDGALLFTTENDIEAAEGRIGVWDVLGGYRRVGSFFSGGVGPHDVMLMPTGDALVVANGGIETHPDSGRAKLNLPFMAPNLSYLNMSGNLLEQHAPPRAWHKNSIRHLAMRRDGMIGFACQWQGDAAQSPPLLGLHRRGQKVTYCVSPDGQEQAMHGYAGSIAFSGDGQQIAITGPRGNRALIFDVDGTFRSKVSWGDIGGVATRPRGFAFTAGTGDVIAATSLGRIQLSMRQARSWDNHLIAI